MKAIFRWPRVGAGVRATTIPADAKGCIKGAIVGGIAGHYAGHHGVIGARRRLPGRPPRGQAAPRRRCKIPSPDQTTRLIRTARSTENRVQSHCKIVCPAQAEFARRLRWTPELASGARFLRPPQGSQAAQPASGADRHVAAASCDRRRQPAPAELTALFPLPVSEVQLEIGFGGGENLIAQATARPQTGFIGVEPFVNGMAKALAAIDSSRPAKHPSALRRRHKLDSVASRRVAGAHRPDPSRSLAETAALETPLCSGRDDRAVRPLLAARRRISLRHRYRRLCRLDAAAFPAIGGFRMDRAMRRRLATALGPDLPARAITPKLRASSARLAF